MIESLLGGVVGGVFRLAPEVMKLIDRKNERAHELAMLAANIEADKLRAQQQIALVTEQNAGALNLAEVQALVAATNAQAAQTGIRWVDALNSLVRPLLAFQWLLLLWPAAVIAGFVLAVQGGTPALEALRGAFGTEEQTLASGIAAFWLVDRSLRRMRP